MAIAPKTDEYKKQMREIVIRPNFLEKNYLSTELRVPVTLLQINACSTLASNAIGGSIWDNFSSQTYKSLPSVGEITYYHPVTGEPRKFKMPAGGRGYIRPPSLVSLWATAPFLLNDTVGRFDPSPSVEARMKVFNDAIEKMLWPEKRETDPVIGSKVHGPSLIDRTTEDSYIKLPAGFLAQPIADLLKFQMLIFPQSKSPEGIQIGPIPKGTPVGLLANLDLDPDDRPDLLDVFKRFNAQVKQTHRSKGDVNRIVSDFTDLFLDLSKCPDLIVNRGHYFGTDMLDPQEQEPGLSDQDKHALIEFLKTF
jgi:hypothetical protein